MELINPIHPAEQICTGRAQLAIPVLKLYRSIYATVIAISAYTQIAVRKGRECLFLF